MPLSALVLFLAALLHEDVAILAAAFFVVQQGMPLPLALGLVYVGVLVNNLLIYALGKTARRWPVARTWLIGERVARVRRALERHFVPAVLFCRLTPGVMYATFLACGWFRMPFPRFALFAAIAAAFYVPLMLTLVVMFGEIVLQRLSEWGWLMAAMLVAATVVVIACVRFGRTFSTQRFRGRKL